MSSSSPTVRIARWSATHPWRAIGLSIALVAAALALMISVPTRSPSEEDSRIGQSGQAADLLDIAGPCQPRRIGPHHRPRRGARPGPGRGRGDARLRGRSGHQRHFRVGPPFLSGTRDALLVPVAMTERSF